MATGTGRGKGRSGGGRSDLPWLSSGVVDKAMHPAGIEPRALRLFAAGPAMATGCEAQGRSWFTFSGGGVLWMNRHRFPYWHVPIEWNVLPECVRVRVHVRKYLCASEWVARLSFLCGSLPLLIISQERKQKGLCMNVGLVGGYHVARVDRTE